MSHDNTVVGGEAEACTLKRPRDLRSVIGCDWFASGGAYPGAARIVHARQLRISQPHLSDCTMLRNLSQVATV